MEISEERRKEGGRERRKEGGRERRKEGGREGRREGGENGHTLIAAILLFSIFSISDTLSWDVNLSSRNALKSSS